MYRRFKLNRSHSNLQLLHIYNELAFALKKRVTRQFENGLTRIALESRFMRLIPNRLQDAIGDNLQTSSISSDRGDSNI